MIIEQPIETPRLTLASLVSAHANGAYRAWMNDPEIVKYLEARGRPYVRCDLESYIDTCNGHPGTLLLGLFDKADHAHIGNIKLGPIDQRHRRGDIGLVLGDKRKWGRGFGREAIVAMTDHAFRRLGMHKVTAGCYRSNIGSLRAFLCAGWHEEARRLRHCFCDGRWEDVILLARFQDDA